ncbi:hypothetical protein GCM10010452_03830 [Crossiella cryophila]
MQRRRWEDLPTSVREAVQQQCGPVTAVDYATTGVNSAFAATLHTEDGLVFCKGTTDTTSAAHRTEVRVAPYLPAVAAPRLLWHTDESGWLLLGFEHVAGQHADLSPESPHIDLVVEALHILTEALTPCPPVEVPHLSDKLARVAPWRRLRQAPPKELEPWRDRFDEFIALEGVAIEAVRGDSLAHTDLNPLNILITDRAKIIDWAWAHRAAPWVDSAHLVIRLIASGHAPQDAEARAASLRGGSGSAPEKLTAFAVTVFGWWEWLRVKYPAPQRARLVEAASTWAAYRLSETRLR